MKSSRPSFTYHPFAGLETRLKDRPSRPSAQPPKEQVAPETTPEDERQFFLDAMRDVTLLPPDDRAVKGAEAGRPPKKGDAAKGEALLALRDLVERGKGFVVADTPEYIEGVGYGGNIAFARRLHRGDFSIQGHIDLHGLNAAEAEEAIELFLEESVAGGRRAVSVIHGRGLSSQAEPVLKNKVVERLTKGRWRKWVIAYASARACDGGAGATYVLLRDRPCSRGPGRRPSKRGRRKS